MKKILLFLMLVLSMAGCANTTITGGIGRQFNLNGGDPSNIYGQHVGKIDVTKRLNEDFYVECSHVSGLGSWEADYGMNYCGGGFIVEF